MRPFCHGFDCGSWIGNRGTAIKTTESIIPSDFSQTVMIVTKKDIAKFNL